MNHTHHFLHYFILIIGFLVFFVCFWLFKYQAMAQLLITFFGALFYCLWGILHHSFEGRLNKFIVAEYVLMSILVFALVAVVLIL